MELGNREEAFEYFNQRLSYEREQENNVGEAEASKTLGWTY
jgi:hypothetical protein